MYTTRTSSASISMRFTSARQISGAGGRDADARFWCHVAIFTALAQMPYYELIPWGLPIVMVAAASALRTMVTLAL